MILRTGKLILQIQKGVRLNKKNLKITEIQSIYYKTNLAYGRPLNLLMSADSSNDSNKKSRLRETLNLSTDADHRTDIFLGWGW